MVCGACHRAAHRETRIGGRETLAEARALGEHPGCAVPAALVALRHVVEKRGYDQVAVGLAALDKPPRGRCAVHDVSRMLAAKNSEEFAAEEACRQFEVSGAGWHSRLPKLAKPFFQKDLADAIAGVLVREDGNDRRILKFSPRAIG